MNDARNKIKRSMVLPTCQHTNAKLDNLGNNNADDSYTAKNIKNWSSSYNIYIHYIKNKFAQGECH